MALTRADVVPYLLQGNLVSASSVVEGDLTVSDLSRRNNNFGILCEHNHSYLIKQGVDPERKETLANEAAVYRFLLSVSSRDELAQYLPRYCSYDSKNHILVLELFKDARDLQTHHARHGRFSAQIAASVGNALGLLHGESGAQQITDGSIRVHVPPGVLSIHRPDLGTLRDISGANLEVIKIIQQSPDLCRLLDELRQQWRVEALIHFDFKWDNCLVSSSRAEPAGKTRLKIVDWELAGLGDPAWDVGSVFAAYLGFWLFAIPVTGETPPDRFLHLTPYPLERMQPALRSFWRSYVRRLELDAIAADERLLRAVRYGAARLAQTSYEQMHMGQQLTANVVCSLQLSLNILQRPKDAVVHLLGIPLDGE